MPKTLVEYNLGPRNTPQEVKELRRSNFDYHEQLGYPVIHKHRWNERDFRNGRVQQCPLHDDILDQDVSYDNICFGTGYVGGFGDPSIVNVSIADAPEDVFRLTPQGVLIRDQHPQMTAPWIPEMGDGDLIIVADFDPISYEILDLHDRYVLREVNPATIRGPNLAPSHNALGRPLRVSQASQLDKLPYNHYLYEVPVIFDQNIPLPQPISPTPIPEGYSYTEFEVSTHIRGAETHTTASTSRDVRVSVAGTVSSTTTGVRIKGASGGVIIRW